MVRTTESSMARVGALSSSVHRPVAIVLVPEGGLRTRRGHSR
jgi:hypothetical protein